MMKSHTRPRALAVDYIALTLAAVLWYTHLLSGIHYPIHEAKPVLR
jgi:hypothetical protein